LGTITLGADSTVLGACPCGGRWKTIDQGGARAVPVGTSEDPHRTLSGVIDPATITCERGHTYNVESFDYQRDGISVTLGDRRL
jgi:hypothetical protein